MSSGGPAPVDGFRSGALIGVEVSPFRPDLVDIWIFRAGEFGWSAAGAGVEILMLKRAPGRILPGLWQCVSGSLEGSEPVPAGALRELREETGFGADDIEAFYDLDQVNQFHEPSVGAILTSAIFAVRVKRRSQVRISNEHDEMRWMSPTAAYDLAIWPAYCESIRRIQENLLNPKKAIWFELTLEGQRVKQ
jgi:8-oxo-dGTP pyrophosphatase MutT (NUDIX family)